RLELGRARVDELVDGLDPVLRAQRGDVLLRGAGRECDLLVAVAELLRLEEQVLRERCAAELLLELDELADVLEEPGIDLRRLEEIFRAPSRAVRDADREQAVLVRNSKRARQRRFVLREDLRRVARVEPEPGTTGLEAAQRLLQRLLERPTDRHRLADALHLRRQRAVGALELLKGEAGDLDDAVVDRPL